MVVIDKVVIDLQSVHTFNPALDDDRVRSIFTHFLEERTQATRVTISVGGG